MVRDVGSQYGWAKNVYDFGNSFIHLSSAHDYLARDPFQAFAIDDRQTIANFLNHYHGDEFRESVSVESTFEAIYPYVPEVLKKISRNLEFSLEKLRQEVTS